MPTVPKHWQYFLSVEEDLAQCARYVAFCEENFSSFSNEFAKLIVLAASEVDSILRELCDAINPAAKANNIVGYRPVVLSRFPHFNECQVAVPRYKLRIGPWSDWALGGSPKWWGKGFNKLKHDRFDNFGQANLENALRAVGGLFLVVLHYHQHLVDETVSVDFSMRSRLFETAQPKDYKGGVFWNYGEPWEHVLADAASPSPATEC